MESNQFNKENELRVQELYEVSISKCARAAKCNLWGGIVCTVLLLALMYTDYCKAPMLGLKIAVIVAVALMCIYSLWISVKEYTRMSKSGDVNELLHLHGEWKKNSKKYYIAISVILYLSFVILHFKGSFNASFILVYVIVFGAVFAGLCWMLSRGGMRDCREIREIKEIVQAN